MHDKSLKKSWVTGWLIIVTIILISIGAWVYLIDPYFHYHKPDIDTYFYKLNNERSQNDGISKHFDYDALITGTSMTQNFKTSEMDEIFGVNSIKVTYSGGSYKEINDNLIVALNSNPDLRIIVRGLDMGYFFDQASRMREDLGEYPTYLYDSNIFNDVNYLFNKDIIFGRVYPMTWVKGTENFSPGITSFDEYSNWQYSCKFGRNIVKPEAIEIKEKEKFVHLSEFEKETIADHISQNVTSLASKYPEVDFYYFFTPYSIAWWKAIVSDGTIYKQIEAEKYIIELILEHDNIHLYSFNNRTDITTDLNNYKDVHHYAQWINSLILRWMHDGEYLLTKENYQEYISNELEFYTTFDYDMLNEQEDYENDFYAAALLNEELMEVSPISFSEVNEAELIESDSSMDNLGNSYISAKVELQNVDNYRYLVFYGRKISNLGQFDVCVYNNQKEKVAGLSLSCDDIDNEWHQYVIDITDIKGNVTMTFNEEYRENTESSNCEYVFRDIVLY